MAEPKITVLANLGDRNALDYGGHIVFQAEMPDGRITYHSEFWEEPVKRQHRMKPAPKEDVYEVYRWDIEPDAVKDLDWAELASVAESIGVDPAQFEASGRSENPVERAMFYEQVGRHHGFENLDSYPVTLTRKEMEERWSKSDFK